MRHKKNRLPKKPAKSLQCTEGFISYVAKGSKKTWIAARLWPQTCVESDLSFAAAQNCYGATQKNWSHTVVWRVLSQVLCITPVFFRSKRWVLGHGIHNGVFLFSLQVMKVYVDHILFHPDELCQIDLDRQEMISGEYIPCRAMHGECKSP